MPLLDGKYEILAESPLGPGVVRFDATTADGLPVRVVWYELGPEDEAAFERYRRALRALARDGVADVLEVVSRPGARYVAWRDARVDSEPLEPNAQLAARLSQEGLEPSSARVRVGESGPCVSDLPFGSGVAPERTAVPTDARSEARSRDLLSVSDAALSWALAGVLLLIAVGLWGGGFALRVNDAVVRVPEVGSAGVEVTAEQLVALGLRVEPVPLTSSEPEGTVLAIDPEPGATLRPGRSVRVSYAVPPGRLAPATVPSVLGLDLDAANTLLAESKLELGRVVRVHEEAPAGSVLSQSASPGTVLGAGSEVHLVVSSGPAPHTTFLPDLTGLPEDDARALASVAGFASDQVTIERIEVSGSLPGTVVGQSLAPHRRVTLEGAALRLLVAGASSVLVHEDGLPNLAGMSEELARDLARGFEVEVSYVEDGVLPDGVVRQSLRPGSTPDEGPLRLTVNVRPVAIPVPEVVLTVREPRLREVPYVWFVEPGIPTQIAQVTAVRLDGVRTVVRTQRVQGGDRVEGSWLTTYPGPVRFELTLNGEPYGGELLVP